MLRLATIAAGVLALAACGSTSDEKKLESELGGACAQTATLTVEKGKFDLFTCTVDGEVGCWALSPDDGEPTDMSEFVRLADELGAEGIDGTCGEE